MHLCTCATMHVCTYAHLPKKTRGAQKFARKFFSTQKNFLRSLRPPQNGHFCVQTPFVDPRTGAGWVESGPERAVSLPISYRLTPTPSDARPPKTGQKPFQHKSALFSGQKPCCRAQPALLSKPKIGTGWVESGPKRAASLLLRPDCLSFYRPPLNISPA